VDTTYLAALVSERRTLEAAIRDEVLVLRRHGADWATIGRALGVSRQAVRQRFT
jgi:hypothetical protein